MYVVQLKLYSGFPFERSFRQRERAYINSESAIGRLGKCTECARINLTY